MVIAGYPGRLTPGERLFPIRSAASVDACTTTALAFIDPAAQIIPAARGSGVMEMARLR
jgi:hypothetical protein